MNRTTGPARRLAAALSLATLVGCSQTPTPPADPPPAAVKVGEVTFHKVGDGYAPHLPAEGKVIDSLKAGKATKIAAPGGGYLILKQVEPQPEAPKGTP